jgi:DNA-binding transcriptional ArsR family regulator
VDSADLDRTLSALADRTRRSIVELLRDHPRRAGELARELAATPAGISRHLRVLRQSQLVEEQSPDEDARVRVYRLRREPFAGLQSWVEDVQSFWEGQLASFREHAERTRGKGGVGAAPSPTRRGKR